MTRWEGALRIHSNSQNAGDNNSTLLNLSMQHLAKKSHGESRKRKEKKKKEPHVKVRAEKPHNQLFHPKHSKIGGGGGGWLMNTRCTSAFLQVEKKWRDGRRKCGEE